jgi:mRNA interferase RelE/StbE
MESYELRFAKSFDRDFRSLPRHETPKILERVLKLEDDPRPAQSRKLKGTKNEYRLRVGDYRVFYTIDDKGRVVTVFHVAHRREAYR